MYLDCFKNHGKPYLRLVENYTEITDNKKKKVRKTIKNLGPLSKYDDGEPDFVKRMKGQLHRGELIIDGIPSNEFKKRAKLSIIFDEHLDVNNFHLNLKNIGYFFLEPWVKLLGISDVLNRYKNDSKTQYDILGITKLLIFERILEPKSKKTTFMNRDKYLFPITTSKNLNDIYKTLDVLSETSESIQIRMNTKIKQSEIGRVASITYYDVTNYFFETHYPDEDIYQLDSEGKIEKDEKGNPIILKKGFRKRGFCKRKSGKPLVSMGLFIDDNGIPVSYKTFPGNTHESTGFKNIIVPTLNNKDLGKVILVADNAMYDQEAQKLLVENGNGYIISKSVRETWNTKPKGKNSKTLKQWALDEKYNEQYDKNNNLIFKSKSRVYERVLKDINGEKITIKEKQVLFWNIKYYRKNLHEHEKLINELEFYKNNPNLLLQKKKKYKKFVKMMQIDQDTGEIVNPKDIVILLDKKIQREKEILGYYSIVTSEIELEDEEIIDKYKGLSKIEDSFRIIKTDLEGKPIYVWTEEHINAHFLICYIALTIIRLIQFEVLRYQEKEMVSADGWKQGITAEKIRESLNKFQIDKNNKRYYRTTEPDKYINLLSDSIGVNSNLELPSIDELYRYKHSLYTSF